MTKKRHKKTALASMLGASEWTGIRATGPITAENRQLRRLREREERKRRRCDGETDLNI